MAEIKFYNGVYVVVDGEIPPTLTGIESWEKWPVEVINPEVEIDYEMEKLKHWKEELCRAEKEGTVSIKEKVENDPAHSTRTHKKAPVNGVQTKTQLRGKG